MPDPDDALARHSTRIAVDVDLYGYKSATLTPPPTDTLESGGVTMHRVVLTPEAPRVVLTLAGGREVHITGWANVPGKTGLEQQLAKVRAERDRYREALTFYADERNYGEESLSPGVWRRYTGHPSEPDEVEWDDDVGQRARAALADPAPEAPDVKVAASL